MDVARDISEYGSQAVKTVLVIDALSVLSAVTAVTPKIPTEKGLMVLLRWLREQLETGRCYAIVWVDTRDMLADALTKGSVDRAALHQVMEGTWHVQHEPNIWTARKR